MSFDVTAGPFIVPAVFACAVAFRGYLLRKSVEIRYLPYTNNTCDKEKNDT
jgi:hypothetical protein